MDAQSYIEKNFLSKDIRNLSADDFIKLIQKIHEISAKSLYLGIYRGRDSGKFTHKSNFLARETHVLNEEYVAIENFSEHNYNLLKRTESESVADAYKRFCEKLKQALQQKIEFIRNLKEPITEIAYNNTIDISQLIIEKDIGTAEERAAYFKVLHFLPDPIDINQRMLASIKILVKKIRDGEDPWLIAAFAHNLIAHLHPFANGNGRGARLLANSILMHNGVDPICMRQISSLQNYFHAANNGVNDINIFVDYMHQCAEMTKALKSSIKPLYPVEYKTENNHYLFTKHDNYYHVIINDKQYKIDGQYYYQRAKEQAECGNFANAIYLYVRSLQWMNIKKLSKKDIGLIFYAIANCCVELNDISSIKQYSLMAIKYFEESNYKKDEYEKMLSYVKYCELIFAKQAELRKE